MAGSENHTYEHPLLAEIRPVYRYLLCALVCMALCVIVTHKTNLWFEAKMARQLFNVGEIKYRCLSNGGQSVIFVNRFGKFIQSSNRISEMFFFSWCSVDKFSPHISVYHLGHWRFVANKNFVKEVRIKVEFSELSQKAFTTMIHFWKRLSMENLILSKGLKMPNTKSFKIAGLSRAFSLHNLHEQPQDLMCRLTSRSLGWKSRVNSAADLGGTFIVLDVIALAFAQIINMRETGHWETDWIVISSKESSQLRQFCLLSVILWKHSYETKSWQCFDKNLD